MAQICLAVNDIIDEVEAAADDTKQDERQDRVANRQGIEELAAKDKAGEDDAILDPLRWPQRTQSGTRLPPG